MRPPLCVSESRGLRLPSSFAWVLVSLLFFTQVAAGHVLDSAQSIGIEERLGAIVPSDICLFDEQGRPASLGAIVRRPTILVLVYYTCDRFCPQLLAGLASALPRLALTPDKDYQIVTVSFDVQDTPARARDTKRNYFMAVNRPFPDAGWRFLTGDRKNIEQLCTAVGFSFRKEHHGFGHPVALIILSPQRQITRYIHVSKFAYGVEYPLSFSAIEVTQALAEAAQGRIGASATKEFLFCFPHEPPGQQRFFHILALVGGGTIIGLALFFVYLSLSGRKTRKGKKQ